MSYRLPFFEDNMFNHVDVNATQSMSKRKLDTLADCDMWTAEYLRTGGAVVCYRVLPDLSVAVVFSRAV